MNGLDFQLMDKFLGLNWKLLMMMKMKRGKRRLKRRLRKKRKKIL